MEVSLLAHTENPEKLTAFAARVCYSGAKDLKTLYDSLTNESVDAFLEKMQSMPNHGTIWEHCVFTFGIEGVSRSLTHQLVRHRIASYDQQSQRYVNASQFEYVIPPSIKNNKDMCIGFKETMTSLQKVYDIMIQNGIPKEDARFILPNATCSRLICTMNIRSLMHFFALRTCTRSQWEIRELANKMFNLCHEVAPKIFNCRMLCDKLGYCSEGSMSCGKAPTLKAVMEVYNGQNS